MKRCSGSVVPVRCLSRGSRPAPLRRHVHDCRGAWITANPEVDETGLQRELFGAERPFHRFRRHCCESDREARGRSTRNNRMTQDTERDCSLLSLEGVGKMVSGPESTLVWWSYIADAPAPVTDRISAAIFSSSSSATSVTPASSNCFRSVEGRSYSSRVPPRSSPATRRLSGV